MGGDQDTVSGVCRARQTSTYGGPVSARLLRIIDPEAPHAFGSMPKQTRWRILIDSRKQSRAQCFLSEIEEEASSINSFLKPVPCSNHSTRSTSLSCAASQFRVTHFANMFDNKKFIDQQRKFIPTASSVTSHGENLRVVHFHL